VLQGDLKPFHAQDFSPLSAKSRDTYDRVNSNDTTTEVVDFATSNITNLQLNITMDVRLNDFSKRWDEPLITLFDLYDARGKTTIPLNYVADQTYPSQAIKKVLLIPLMSDS